jgi:hypothetical protein
VGNYYTSPDDRREGKRKVHGNRDYQQQNGLHHPADRDALRKVAQEDQNKMALKIGPLGQIPRHPVVPPQVILTGQQPISQDQGIDHCQMIGTDHPGLRMILKHVPPLSAQPIDVPDPVPLDIFQKDEIKRHSRKGCDPAYPSL